MVTERKRPGRKPARHDPAVAAALQRARVSARLTMTAMGALVGVGGRAVARWERSLSTPSKATMLRLVSELRRYDVAAATTLARALAVEPALPPAPPPPSPEALRAAVLEVADRLDAAPSKTRRALGALFDQILAAHFTLEGATAALAAWSREVEPTA